MKFNHLQASIANNADQAPSLYMALCMVESLFGDVEDACGMDINDCPAGDEHLSSKLVWLCRVINDIYKDKDQDLQRNRPRLDAAMKKLNDTQKELEAVSSIADRLTVQKAEYAALEQRLQKSRIAAKEYEQLAVRCDQAKQQLEALAQFDPAAARTQLARLADDIAAKEKVKAELSAQLKLAGQDAASLQQDVEKLRNLNENIQNQNEMLKTQLYREQKANAQLQTELDKLKASCKTQETERQQLFLSQNEAQKELDRLCAQTSAFHEEKLVPVQTEVDVIRQKLVDLEQHKHALDQEHNQLKNKRNQLILDIAHQKEENEMLSKKQTLTQASVDTLKSEKNGLDAALSNCLQELETLQEEVAKLENKRLPEARSLHQLEQKRREELLQSIAQFDEQRNAVQNDIRQMESRLPALQEELENERIVYNALTANYTASSKELESLERQIAELRNNKADEKLVIYRNQLEETQQRLENIQAECVLLEQENEQKQKDLENGQNERARLQKLKRRFDDGLDTTEKQLRELAFAGNAQYLRELMSLEERAKFLENVHTRFTASVTNMQRILGCAPFEEHSILEDQLKYDLRALRHHIGDLQSALLTCAKSLKLEEQ